MHPRIPQLAPEALDPEQRALYDDIAAGPRAQGPQHFPLTDAAGALRGPFGVFLLSPDLGRAVQQVGAAVRFGSALSARERELAILLVAARWNSAFEREAHEAVGMASGLTPGELAALRAESLEQFAGREALVGEVVIALLDGDLDDALWARAHDELGAPLVFQLSTLAGYYAMLALQLRIFRIDDYGFTP